MKKTGLDVSDLITLVQRKGGGNTGFPYKSFVCRCSNCLYSTKGKCALKECCCMDERIRAHTCTFGEMMRYCFSGIGDNVFQFRLRLAIEREAELKSCLLGLPAFLFIASIFILYARAFSEGKMHSL